MDTSALVKGEEYMPRVVPMRSFQIINKLTFAGLDAICPRIRIISVAEISAFLVPSTAGSATAGCAGLPDDAALGTYVIGRR